MKLTQEQLIAGTGCAAFRAEFWLAPIQATLDRYEINTPLRIAAFLAQIGHESGCLKYAREIWGPTPAQVRYEGREDLGNTQPGDGKLFMGRGPIQITGRHNYESLTAAMESVPGAPDFVATPGALEQPQWGALAAGWFWDSRRLNMLADAGDFLAITKKINGGTNGYPDRLKLHHAAKQAFA